MHMSNVGFTGAFMTRTLLVAFFSLLAAPAAQAADTEHRLLTTGSSNLTAAPTASWTNGTPGTGTAGDWISYASSSSSATLTLDTSLTIGAIRQLNDGVFIIAPGAGVLTLDGTGLSAANTFSGTA